MIIENLLNDIKESEQLRLVFNVKGLGDGVNELVLNELTEYNCYPEDLPLGIAWFMETKDYDYWAFGYLNDKLYVIGMDGDLKEINNFYDVPFILSPDLVECEERWNNLKIIDSHLYYFSYCEKNGYPVSPQYSIWGQLLENKKIAFSQEVKLDLSYLLTDLMIDKRLQGVFDYFQDKDKALSVAQSSLELGNGWKGFDEIFKEIDWCFLTSDSTFCAIGLLKSTIFFMDSEGAFSSLKCGIYDLPFLLKTSPFLTDWKNIPEETLDNYLYYFSYCEKNRILLLPENYAWKAKLQEIKRSVEE